MKRLCLALLPVAALAGDLNVEKLCENLPSGRLVDNYTCDSALGYISVSEDATLEKMSECANRIISYAVPGICIVTISSGGELQTVQKFGKLTYAFGVNLLIIPK